MKLTAIDPGITTGYARFEDTFPVAFGTVQFGQELWDFIADEETDLWVVEDYKIRIGSAARGYDHAWSAGETLQVIGAIKYEAHNKGLPEPVLQQPSIKPVGYRLMGMEYVKGKSNMHIYDALAHGRYFNHKNPARL